MKTTATYRYKHDGEDFTVTEEFSGKASYDFCVVCISRPSAPDMSHGIASRHKRHDLAEKEIKFWRTIESNNGATLAIGERV